MTVLSVLGVLLHGPTEITTERYQSGLIKFRVTNRQQGRWKIDVGERQMKRFAEAQRRRVEEQQQRAKGLRLEMISRGPVVIRRFQQPAYLVTREHVWHERRRSFRNDGRERGAIDESATLSKPIKSAQGRVLAIPKTRQRPLAVEESLHACRRNRADLDVRPHGATKRVEELGRRAEIRPGGLAKGDVLGDGLATGRHTSPSRLKSATCRRLTRLTLAYSKCAAAHLIYCAQTAAMCSEVAPLHDYK